MIGVAGCGRMGLPMLAALRDAGADAYGFDVVDTGSALVTRDVAGFARRLETLFTVVRDQTETEEVLFGAQNFVGTAPNLRRIFICSTLSPRYVRALRDRVPENIILIDAPMSGAQIAAQERRLSFMLGGDAQDLDDAMPLLGAMGNRFHRMGAFGSGSQAKVLNNLLAAANTAMTRLVLDWADAADLDAPALLALIHDSSGQNWFASHFDTIEFARNGHGPDNTIGILVKDVASALDAAPADGDKVLPQTVMTALRNLKPRP